jgi:hypothetical protein
VPAFIQVAGQEDPKLTGGEISAIPANQRDDGVAEKADLGIGNRIGGSRHV